MGVLEKARCLIKEHGVMYTIKKVVRRIVNELKEEGLRQTVKTAVYFARIKFVNVLSKMSLLPFVERKYRKVLNKIPLGDRVILWEQNFGWNVALFQRPQHIARCLAQKGCTFFYYTSIYSDPDVKAIKEIAPNLYLVNRNNTVFMNVLKTFLKETDKEKYLQVYSTNLELSLEEMKEYEADGYHIFYEYIDDLAPEISGTKEIPKNIQDKFDYVTKDSRIPMAVTADLLKKEIIGMRGEENLVFATNGVDVSHFKNNKPGFVFNEAFSKVLKEGKKIVGYYGAIAKWFDYELLTYAAKQLPNVNFVLIGAIYDESFSQSCMKEVPNIHFIGPVPYQDLPQYANKFDLYTIPFVVNSITNATSPLKLFEYMAMGKPVLTTAMLESSKYQSVNIAHDYAEYVEKIEQLLKYTPETNPEYYALLQQDAANNTWEAKADAILEMLCRYERNIGAQSAANS